MCDILIDLGTQCMNLKYMYYCTLHTLYLSFPSFPSCAFIFLLYSLTFPTVLYCIHNFLEGWAEWNVCVACISPAVIPVAASGPYLKSCVSLGHWKYLITALALGTSVLKIHITQDTNWKMAYEFVRVLKNPGESLGLGFNKNSEEQGKVYAILEGTALQRSKQVSPGDVIVQINDRDVKNLTSAQLIDMISTLQDDTEVTLKVLHPNTSKPVKPPIIAVDSVDTEVQNGVNDQTHLNIKQRSRKTPVVSKDSLPKITEAEEQSKPIHLQPKELHSVSKRLSLTPETKHKTVAPLQPSKSLDLGALPTWRSKTFINLHNYWTGEQHSDRLYTHAEQVRYCTSG